MNPLLNRLFTDVPFLTESAVLRIACQDIHAAEDPYYRRIREKVKPQATLHDGGVASVPMIGALVRRPSIGELLYYDVEDTQTIYDLFASVASSNEVSSIVLEVDSPGGILTGGPELADLISRTKNKKPVVTWTGGYMASLAYWAGSQATTVIATRSAQVGSIGAYIAHYDWTKFLEKFGITVELFKNKEGTFKAAGLTGVPLTDEQRDYLKASAQKGFNDFRRQVISARPNIPAEAMQGQVFDGDEAKKFGLVDRIGDFQFALGVARKLARST